MKINGKRNVFVLFAFLLLVLHGTSFAQNAEAQKSSWLLGVLFKLENMRTAAMENIQKLEREIQKCDSTINKSENIVRLAREQGNAQTETIAREASDRARAAKAKNIGLKNSAELNKKKAEIALAHVKNAFSEALANPQKIKSVITSYSGRVSIQKKNGEIIDFDMNQMSLLEKGDEIVTYGDGSAELQFLDGRGAMKVGPDSRVKMEEDDADAQVMSLIRGKLDISVEKLENYQKMMGKKIKAYEEDFNTVKDKATQKIIKAYGSTIKYAKKINLQLPSIPWIMTIQGTRLIVHADEKKGTEIVVLEGSVEIKSKNEDRAVVVDEGYRAVVAMDGKLSGPEKIDLSKLEGWGEK